MGNPAARTPVHPVPPPPNQQLPLFASYWARLVLYLIRILLLKKEVFGNPALSGSLRRAPGPAGS